jgi:phage host-nuclease inhibitor protein Gam
VAKFSLFDLIGRSKPTDQNTILPAENKDQVGQYLHTIGELQRELMALENAMNDEMATLRKKYSEQAAPIALQIDSIKSACTPWCEMNRRTLLKEDEKTADLGTGTVSWRKNPDKLQVPNQDDAIKWLVTNDFGDFVEIKKSLLKDAIKSNWEKLQAKGEPDGLRLAIGKESLKFIPAHTKLEV